MRIAMLINNTCENDARVIREARALSDAGHEVYILAVWATGLAREEVRDGVTYLRFTLPWHAGQRTAARIPTRPHLLDRDIPQIAHMAGKADLH
jgi:hypothetical protein